jgi:uncharacterized glyoxalase superfamily protein PhnB
MRFNSICLVTNDVPSLASFYQKILQVKTEGDRDYAKVFIEGANFSIFSREGMERMAPGCTHDLGSGSVVVEIQVDNVDVEYQRLKQMDIKFIKLPTTQEWGIRSFWFIDPDGNIINFYAQV